MSNVSRILLPKKPKSVLVNNKIVNQQQNWDQYSMTYLLEFENNPDGVSVLFTW